MQIRIAALADYTNITNNGKLNILGIFSQIHASSVPTVHAQMHVVAQFAFEPFEAGEKKVRVALQDEDGNQILALEGVLTIAPTTLPDPIVVNQVLPLQNIVFPHFGSYEFVMELDGEPLPTKIPVDILPIAPAAMDG